jgi:NifU-like protein involved in Fe-S cluster formation
MSLIRNPIVMNLFLDQQYAGELPCPPDYTVQVGREENGEVLKLDYNFSVKQAAQVFFKAYGCVELYASAEFYCRLLHGKTRTQVLKIALQDALLELNLPKTKLHIQTLLVTAHEKFTKEYLC